MKKFALALALAATLVVALVSAGPVFAQANTPANPQAPGGAYGRGGMMGGQAMRGSAAAVGDGILHDAMIAVYAQELGVPVADLNARLESGETLAQIAYAQGLTAEEITALIASARSQAVDQAIKGGVLTQEQASWMQQRGARQNGYSQNGARMGGRGGNFANPDCPIYPQIAP